MEQQLLEDLVVESIKIYGNDMYYLPRSVSATDSLYGSDEVAIFENAIPIELYIKSVDGFEGDGTFLSKFNVEIRDEIVLSVAMRTFMTEVVETVNSFVVDLESIQNGPRQGDLIYFPMANRFFQISYVNEKPVMYQLGAMPFWDLKCHMFEYSGEIIETGVAEVDQIMDKFPVTYNTSSVLTESTRYLVTEAGLPIVFESYTPEQGADLVIDDSEVFESEADDFLDFSQSNPFAVGGNY
jgi:hypothetical protein